MAGPITEYAKAKVNLALHVLGRRGDGYHILDSIVAFADTGDRLTFEEAPQTRLAVTGPFGKLLETGSGNIVLKAAEALAAASGGLPLGAAITLEKNLPIASGIGGGSADAAATLRGLIRLWKLRLSEFDLKRIALKLGADVPVCLPQQYCRMRGIGEEINLLGTPPWQAITLVNPRVSQLTQDVFKKLGLEFGERFRSGLDAGDPARWRNDLEAPAMSLLPVIGEVRDALLQAGGQTVRMSGSGATCFALCESLSEAEAIAAQVSAVRPSWWVSAARLA